MGWLAIAVLGVSFEARGADGPSAAERFHDEVEPILIDYCYGCHADGMKKGKVAFDGFASDDALVRDRTFWWSVLKNVRSGIMPPAKKPRPSRAEMRVLEDWIKREVFGIDPENPDPGRVTIRRLNRVEYRNTIRDLTGVDFRTDEEFPPDDTGYGFDNIADVLTVSPLLLEKYMQAAETIVAQAVPTVSDMVASRMFRGSDFRTADGKRKGEKMSFYDAVTVSHPFKTEKAGTYRVAIELDVRGHFDFDPGRCKVAFKVGDRELLTQEFMWQDNKKYRFEFKETWQPGDYPLSFELEPLTKPEEKRTSVDLRIASVLVEGPLEREHWIRPKNFDRFFSRDTPATPGERREYARELLARFARKAYRRPLDERNLERLVALAESVDQQPGKSFEQGVAQAIVAMLSSPRFLFRVEEPVSGDAADAFPLLDEYALAARLSYFLWSTTPDDELARLADHGELRKNLAAQVARMSRDSRADMLISNFVGQWVQARDIETVTIDAREILARDSGDEKDLQREREEFRALIAQREVERKKSPQGQRKGQQNQFRQMIRERFPHLFGPAKVELDDSLRYAMRRETEMFFGSIVRDDRSVLDLLDSDFTFLNERLAKLYGVPGVSGEEMRLVNLPKESPRGGLLTQGTVLLVTSNPTRTSPVKRGLFILENILGTPPPPPPAAVPALEDSEKGFKEKEPSLREVLALHRSQPLCHSCHSRMDPLGLALENFNALGLWRDSERKQPLDTAGQLITGEVFSGIRDLKRILKEERRTDFYRCLTEKLLTYALGRGLEFSDVEAVDRIVDRLEKEQGKFSALLTGIIESAPFQRRRSVAAASVPAARPSQPPNRTATEP